VKIAFVNNAAVCSGCEDHLLDLAPWLREHGVEPVFLIRPGSILEERLETLRIRYHAVFDKKRSVTLPVRIARAIVAESPDVISINREHNILPVHYTERLIRPFLNKTPKMVAVFHTPTGRRYPGLAKFDGIIATSEYTGASFVRANPGIESRMSIIHYGIHLPPADAPGKFDRDRPRRYFKDRKFPIIGMVGELWKNQEELVDAAVSMRKAFPRLTVAIIGGYDESVPLKRRIAQHGLEEQFVLTGRIPRNLMADVFYDLDLSVSTHRNEGFGIVHIESLAGSTPVVAYNSGGLVEILREGGSVLVDGTTDDFSRAVIALLTDDTRRRELGMEGRRVVEANFSIDVMGRSHLRFYENLLRNGGVKGRGGTAA